MSRRLETVTEAIALVRKGEDELWFQPGVSLGGAETKELMLELGKSTTILKVNFGYIALEVSVVKLLGDALRKSASIAALLLSNCEIGDEGVELLADALMSHENSSCLEMLRLENNAFGAIGAVALAKLLEANTKLSDMNISGNDVGDMGAKALGDALAVNSSLRYMSCSSCGIGDQGAESVAHGLLSNCTLKVLEMEQNFLTENGPGANALVDCLEENTTLRELEFGADGLLDRERLMLFRQLMERNKTGRVSKVKTRSRIRRLGSAQRSAVVEALEQDDSCELGRARVSVVGAGRSGKTSTVRSLLGLRYSPMWVATPGFDVKEVQVDEEEKKWTEIQKTAPLFDEHLYRAALSRLEGRASDGPTNAIRRRRQRTNQEKKNNVMPIVDEDEDEEEEEEEGSTATNLREPLVPAEEISDRVSEDRLMSREPPAIYLSIWEFGGNEVYYSLHDVFLSESGVFLLVFNMSIVQDETRDGEVARYLATIRSHAPNTDVILVGSHAESDGVDPARVERVISRSVAKDFGVSRLIRNERDDLSYFPVDNFSGLGIEDVRKAIISGSQNILKRRIPLRYSRIVDIMQRDSQIQWMEMENVYEIAARFKVRKKSAIAKALGSFMEHGVLVHVARKEALASVVCIQPRWLLSSLTMIVRTGDALRASVTRGAGAKFAADEAKLETTGIASRKLLEFLWKKTGPADVDFLMDFMQRADVLCTYPFAKKNGQYYFIPCMIVEALDGVVNPRFSGASCVFDFSGSFLPDALFQHLLLKIMQYNGTVQDSPPPVVTKHSAFFTFGIEACRLDVVPGERIRATLDDVRTLPQILRIFRQVAPLRLLWSLQFQVPEHPNYFVTYDDLLAAKDSPSQTVMAKDRGKNEIQVSIADLQHWLVLDQFEEL